MGRRHQDTFRFTGLRRYEDRQFSDIMQLFYETVHTVNAKDYSQEQLDVWAPKQADEEKWKKTLAANYTLVYFMNGKIAGFGDMAKHGYLDRLYVSKDFQRCGIATLIMDALETYAKTQNERQITTEASVTARVFFEKRCYKIIKEQQVERQGILLTNYVMKKDI